MGAAWVAHWLARRYARLLDRAVPRLRRVAFRNLAMALPELGRRGMPKSWMVFSAPSRGWR